MAMTMVSTLLSMIFLLSIQLQSILLQPGDSLLLIPPKLQLHLFLLFISISLLLPAAIPPVLLFSLPTMDELHLDAIPPLRRLLTIPSLVHGSLAPTCPTGRLRSASDPDPRRATCILPNAAEPAPTPTSRSTPATHQWRGLHFLFDAADAIWHPGMKTEVPTLPLTAPPANAAAPTRIRSNLATVSALVAVAGTNRRIQLTWKLSAALLGGGFQLVAKILDDEIRARPWQICYAVLLAIVTSTLWHSNCNRLETANQDQANRDGRLPAIPWSVLRRTASLTFLSGGKNMVIDFCCILLTRLRRQPTRRHRRHDDPVVELPGLRREP